MFSCVIKFEPLTVNHVAAENNELRDVDVLCVA